MDDRIREGFEWQIAACRSLGSPLTAGVLAGVLAAADTTTRTGRRILDWPGDPKLDAMMLRIAGGLHALARSGLDAGLSAHYAARSEEWTGEIRRVLAEWDDWLFPWLDNPPQTNEVARSGVLFPGVMEVARRFGPKIDILELGASAGLNLNMDRFSYDLGGVAAGDPASPVKITPEWRGSRIVPGAVEVVQRSGVDLNPIDVADRAIAESMMAYVWPDQPERMERAGAAIGLAQRYPVRVDEADGADWIEGMLAQPQLADTTRLVYHSIALQYFTADARARVEKAVEAAGAVAAGERRIAWLAMEFGSMQGYPRLTLRCWPGGGQEEVLANCHPHGAWVEWTGATGA